MDKKETSDRIKQRILDALTAFGEKAGPTASPSGLRQIRHADLLMRNDKFRLELEEIKTSWAREIAERDEEIAESRRLSPATRKERLMCGPEFLEKTKVSTDAEYKRALKDLCYRWGISDGWDGQVGSLFRYTNSNGQILFREYSGKAGSIPFKIVSGSRGKFRYLPQHGSWCWADRVNYEPAFVYIRLSPETKKEDVLRAWPTIEVLKKNVFGFSGRQKRTFNRDLCFRDLMHRPDEYGFGKLSAGQVMDRWNRHAPASQRVKSSDDVKKGARTIQDYIDRLTVLDSGPSL